MKKLILLLTILTICMVNVTQACTEVFVYRDNAARVGRTMDFPINMGIFVVGYNKGLNQVSSYMDKKHPNLKVAKWLTKYPYLGREIFETGLLVDGANNQGLSAAFLYLPGTEYPQYNLNDSRNALSFYDLVSFALATSKDVNEALRNINKYQVLSSSIIVASGVALKDAPLHLSLKDKSGNSSVIEFIAGKLNIYTGDKAGSILTNYPDLPEQFNNLANYNSLFNYNKEEQKNKFGNIPGFDTMIKSSSLRNNIISMVGIPGDYSPPSRFVRATFLERNIPTSGYPKDYTYMMHHTLDSVTVPYSTLPNSTATQWQTQKNLKAATISYRNILYLYNGKLIVANNDKIVYDINQIFSTGIKTLDAANKLQSKVTNVNDYKYYSMAELPSNI